MPPGNPRFAKLVKTFSSEQLDQLLKRYYVYLKRYTVGTNKSPLEECNGRYLSTPRPKR